jgi:moderate conductance mechanosensitive channel
LLRIVILTYLVAFIVVRVMMAFGRMLLAPAGDPVPAGQGERLGLFLQATPARSISGIGGWPSSPVI